MKTPKTLLLLTLMFILAACGTPAWGQSQNVPAAAVSTPIPTAVPATATSAPVPSFPVPSVPATPESTMQDAGTAPAPTPTLAPGAWKSMPIIPVVSARMIAVYKAGLAAGRNPAHFSKIGDCQNITTYFLASFDDPKNYRLGAQYAYLQPTIDHFAGSWSRESLAVGPGHNVAVQLDPLWADPKQCKAGETPVACEIRVYNPSIVTVSMEESWTGNLVTYNMYLRKIVAYILSQNVVPILATRAEVPGSSNSINDVVARVAYDYQVPLWNFGASALPLPFFGLTKDGFHLTQAGNFFDDPSSMKAGWPWRNLTALESIDAVYRAVSGQP
ncbi:MAG: hypothetical protein WCE68_14550 [Anaerolineales bacterium]